MIVSSEHVNQLVIPWTPPPSLGAEGWPFFRSPFQHYKPNPGPPCLFSLLIRNMHKSSHFALPGHSYLPPPANNCTLATPHKAQPEPAPKAPGSGCPCLSYEPASSLSSSCAPATPNT